MRSIRSGLVENRRTSVSFFSFYILTKKLHAADFEALPDLPRPLL